MPNPDHDNAAAAARHIVRCPYAETRLDRIGDREKSKLLEFESSSYSLDETDRPPFHICGNKINPANMASATQETQRPRVIRHF
jgi:hypothetical protein